MINKCLQPIIDNDGIKILKVIVLCLTAYLLFRLMQGMYYVIQWDFPNHCREATENLAAISFWQGKSPYYENFPHNYSAYGPLYYLFTSLFLSSDSFINAAFVQRTINIICTLLTMAIFVVFSRKKLSSSLVESLPLAAVLGTMLAFFSNELGSKPGCFSFLFAFLGTIIPFWCNFSKRSFVIAVSCCAIAFLSKQISLIFIVVILSYHFLFFGIKRTFFLGLLFVLQTYGLLFLLELLYPNISGPFMFASFSQLAVNIPHGINLLKEILSLTWPIMMFIIVAFLALLLSKRQIKNKVCLCCFILKEYYLLFACAVLFVYYLRIVWHPGNNNIYGAHTYVAFLFLIFLQYVSLYKKVFMKYISFISLIITVLLTVSNPVISNYRESVDYSNSWKKWDALIAEHNNILAYVTFAQNLNKYGKHIYAVGQELFNTPEFSFFYKDELAQKRTRVIQEIKNSIASAQYDLLLLNFHSPTKKYREWWGTVTEEELLTKGYIKTDEDVARSTRAPHFTIHVFKRAVDIKSANK